MHSDARIPPNTGERREIKLFALVDKDDRSAVEGQAHGRRSSEQRANNVRECPVHRWVVSDGASVDPPSIGIGKS